jgi:hypothetical protein
MTATSTSTRSSTPLMRAVGERSASARSMPVGTDCAVLATGVSFWTHSTAGCSATSAATAGVIVAE